MLIITQKAFQFGVSGSVSADADTEAGVVSRYYVLGSAKGPGANGEEKRRASPPGVSIGIPAGVSLWTHTFPLWAARVRGVRKKKSK